MPKSGEGEGGRVTSHTAPNGTLSSQESGSGALASLADQEPAQHSKHVDGECKGIGSENDRTTGLCTLPCPITKPAETYGGHL